ncbi:RINT1-like protein MAG2L [Dioscorea cayenensis subsp. rotundata]|uniref:RINT1-like protein MAG2L n=1 Tax=Dioscorea cayennensis subsp. rotundata TaxID=55577 RepID=A0AB40BNP4_DIOCR|nr:RINT1-like protein MAG2L [Dioscorea cayenensis subsp. rotundata]
MALRQNSPADLLGFLDDHLKTREDLLKLPSLVARIDRECLDLEAGLLSLEKNLSCALVSWISRSDEVREVLRQIDLSRDDNVEGVRMRRARKMIDKELPLLVREVDRIKAVRAYAETTLQLELLVGDLEDAVISIMSAAVSGLKHEKLLLAINATKDIEKVLVDITHSRPRWLHLLMAVDSRVEKALAFLRPQALSDHRALLASLGWPPSLSTANMEKDNYEDIPNPLILMQGEKKEKYSRSFLALCALQHLQAQRDKRKNDLAKYKKEYNSVNIDKQLCSHSGLWTIDELVSPIASRIEYHFFKWSDEPKFIFALVYKVTRDFLEGVDNVLQPLIDEARLVGYSAKESWVSAMVKMLCQYLEREVFPVLAKPEDCRDSNREVTSSWIHLVDIMISFDKRMQILSSSGTTFMGVFAGFEGFSQSLPVMSIFSEHSNWLQIWAGIELKYARDKLRSELEDERSWAIHIAKQASLSYEDSAESFLLSTREDHKAPSIAESFVQLAWAMIERGRSLPGTSVRTVFVRSSVIIFFYDFFPHLVQRCHEIESTASIQEDDMVLRVAGLMNAARYIECVMRDWSEDLIFLEMSAAEDVITEVQNADQYLHNCFFRDEILYLVKLETDYLEEIVSALLLDFNALCWDYIQNSGQWERVDDKYKDKVSDEENFSVSPGFIEALDMLKNRMTILKINLNVKYFLDLWRSVAEGLDHFIFNSIPLSQVKFSSYGVYQFKADIDALLTVFRPFCARPEAFFPCTMDALTLLTMKRRDVDLLLKVLFKGEKNIDKCLQSRGLFHVSASQVENILWNIKVECTTDK